MKKWGEVYIDASSIVDFKEFNRGFNAFKGAFNGGIDRTMQPEDAYDYTEIKSNAFLKAVAFDRPDMTVLQDPSTGALGWWRGLNYLTYSGEWVTIDEFSETDMKAGFLHWEYSFHHFIDQYYTDDSPKRMQLLLLCNGVAVAHITPIGKQIGTFRVCCDFPIVGGNLTFTIKARTVAPGTAERTQTQWHLTSQNHLIIGRWR